MERWLGRSLEQVYAVFRIVMGLLFLQHGLQKLFGVLPAFKGAHPQPPVGSVIWVGGIIELVTGVMMAVGFAAGWAGFFASGMMAVAYFMAHAGQRGPGGELGLPIQNGGELAVVYCFAFLLIAAKGSGIWSVSGPYRREVPKSA